MKKLLIILTVLISWQNAAICGTNKTDKKDDKPSTEMVEIKGKYDKQGAFRIGLQLNSGVMFLTNVESIESHLNAFTDFGITADKFLGNNKSWALNAGLTYTAFKLSSTVRDNDEVPAQYGTYTRTDTKGGNISLPINLKYRSDLIGKRSKLYALGGVTLCKQTGAGRKMITPVSESGVVLSQGKAINLSEKMNGCAINIGTGMEFNTGGLRTLTAGLQYQKGLGSSEGAMVRDNMSLSFGFFF